MAQNPNAVGKTDSECTETSGPQPEGGEAHKNSAATANQNGDQPGCRDGVMPEQEAPERRRSVLADGRSSSSSLSPAQRSSEELPRRNFQIPRKTRERKGGAISLLFWTHSAFLILLLHAASPLASWLVRQYYRLLSKSLTSHVQIEVQPHCLSTQMNLTGVVLIVDWRIALVRRLRFPS